MSEAQADPRKAEAKGTEAAPSPLKLSGGTGNPTLSPEIPPSDDAPTIISRTQPRPLRPEDAFANTLRGKRLAHYELVEPIGVGGMAAVIRAHDMQLDRNVALKILPPDMATDSEIVRRFQQEARAAARLDHENIARVYYCGEEQGLHFISFEFVEGDNLRTILDYRGRLPVPEAIHYILQVATGLAHAAARGVVHRDIKPSNIIITPTGRAKLVDMGLARSLEPQADLGLTQSGVTLGTFDYISPEQALEPREADSRSDIYSLGCTFYHMLTGQAPVPEGTPLRKLHHHQNVAPVDPRQLNPAIPDEVAAVLARMMAKNPKERYQRPEHLVQHLLQLAHKVGADAEVPDGVLFVDAPLPNPPRMRPLVVAVAAACVLATLVVLHGVAPWPVAQPTSPSYANRPGSASLELPPGTVQPDPHPAKTQEKVNPPVASGRVRHDIKTTRELADYLRNKEPAADLFLTKDINLAQEEIDAGNNRVPGLVFEGKDRDLTIQSVGRDALHPVTIRLAYDGNIQAARSWTALTVKGGKMTLRGLRFEVDATEAPRIEMAAIKLQDAGMLRLENCEFVQVNPPSSDQGWLSSVVVEGSNRITGPKSELTLAACFFQGGPEIGGQDAVTVNGAARVQAMNCAFGPHAALFHLRDGASQETDLTLQNTSAFLVDGAAFAMDDHVSCRLDMNYCLVSRPDDANTASGIPATLIRQNSRFLDLLYAGKGNRYHNLGAFWVRSSPGEPEVVAAPNLAEFRNKVRSDDQSLELKNSPWHETDPLALLPTQPRQAFQLNLIDPDLRQVGKENDRLVGIEKCSWGPEYDGKPLPALEKKDALVQRIVDPTGQAVRGAVVYRTLSQAIPDANPGDVILIKATGKMPIEPVRLDKPATNLTIKAFPDYHPLLTLGDTSDPDASLFRVGDGRLNLEQLEFVLRPGNTKFSSQAIVTVTGAGQCLFQHCVATLDPQEAEDVPLAMVALADPAQYVKMGTPPSTFENPEIHFEGCFVRGKGDLVMVQVSRPLDLDAQNSLFALDGSFLVMKGSHGDPSMKAPVQIALDRVTTYLTGHLVQLWTGKDMKDLVRVDVTQAADCLFVSANHSSLVRLEGEVTDEQKVQARFGWSNGHNNAYANVEPMLDDQPSRGEPMPASWLPYDREKWLQVFKDEGHWVGRLKFVAPVEETPLTKLLPANFRILPGEGETQDFGVDVNQLPRPGEGTKELSHSS